MKRIIIAANFLPVSVKKENNVYQVELNNEVEKSGVIEFYQKKNATWIGQIETADHLLSFTELEILSSKLKDLNCIPVFAPTPDLRDNSQGYSIDTLWPVFHYFSHNAIYLNEYWDAYSEMNKLFADQVLEIIKEDDYLWIHDFHLLLLPQLIRQKMPNISIWHNV